MLFYTLLVPAQQVWERRGDRCKKPLREMDDFAPQPGQNRIFAHFDGMDETPDPIRYRAAAKRRGGDLNDIHS